MGCDIHPIVEVRRKGVWHTHRPKTPCRWYYKFTYDHATGRYTTDLDGHGNPIRSGWDDCMFQLPEAFYARNYTMFAILADVRNDGSVLNPMTTGRGLPYSTLAAGSQAWARDLDHSEGYVALDEMEAYDFTEMVYHEGAIKDVEYARVRNANQPPNDWAGSVAGGGTVTISMAQADALINMAGAPILAGDTKFYVQYEWTETCGSAAPEIQAEIMPYLKALVPKGGTSEDVRLLFYFDS